MEKRIAAAEYHRSNLGISPPFDLKQLRKNYHRLMKEWHPDRFFADSSKYAEATEKAKHFNLAFEFLSEFLDEIGGVYFFKSQPHDARETDTKTDTKSNQYRPTRRYEGETYTVGFPDASVTEIFLKSSHIISAGYSEGARTLYIKFKGNSVYCYYDFPQSLFQDFLGAESHGRFAHKWIYHSFQYERC